MTFKVNDIRDNYSKTSPYTEIILGNNYATRSDGTHYYPKDQFGNEYKDTYLNLIEQNGFYVYPVTATGRPRYTIQDGKEVYERVAGKQIIGTGLDENEYYAKDEYGNEYYPEDNSPAKLKNGLPYYARTRDGKHIFPVDKFGNEYYFTNPEVIPNRYAVSLFGDEIYPLRITQDNNEAQYLIGNKYAVDKNKIPFYPKDGFKNEYYKEATYLDIAEYQRKGTLSKILLKKYALTNDGRIIVPEIDNKFYINYKIEPNIKREDVVGKLIRDENRTFDYLTNVSDTTFKPLHIKPYKYRTLITNEIHQVIPKPPPTTLNFIEIVNNTSLPFYQRWCFWAFIFVILIVKSFIIWWFYFKNYEIKNVKDLTTN